MKFEHNAKYSTIAIYSIIVIIVAMLLNTAMQNLSSTLEYIKEFMGLATGIIYGIVFAFLLNPLLRNIESRILFPLFGTKLKPYPRRLIGIALTYIVAGLLIAAFVAIVIPETIASLINVISSVPAYIKYFSLLFIDFSNWVESMLSANIASDSFGLTSEITKQISTSIGTILSSSYVFLERSVGNLITITANLTTGILNLILGIIVSMYVLIDREKLFAQIKRITCAIFPNDFNALVTDISLDISRIFSGFVVGKVIDSIIIGILCMIGASVLKLPYAVLISVIVGVTNVIPYFGPFIGAIPSFILILIVDPMKSLWFLIFILILQQLDGNVIGPKILGDTIGLSPLWIIFSITIFSGLLGVVGMFIGVPLFAIIYSLVKRFTSYLLIKKGKSANTRDYDSDKNPLIK